MRAMNCLAHALLAGDGPGLAVAGVGGDWIKGRRPAAARLPLRLMAGQEWFARCAGMAGIGEIPARLSRRAADRLISQPYNDPHDTDAC